MASACASAEVSALKVRDVESERMLLRVEQVRDMLMLLQEWLRASRQQGFMHSKGWLFPGSTRSS
jgi:integrase/recombinase XerD